MRVLGIRMPPDRLPQHNFPGGRAMIEPAGRGCMLKQVVRNCGAGHRRVPIVANRKFLGQSGNNGKLLGSKTLQDLSRCRTARRVKGYESAVVDSWVRSIRRVSCRRSAEWFENVCELMAGICQRHKIGPLRNRASQSVKDVRFVPGQATHLSWLAGLRSRPLIIEKPSIWSKALFSSMSTKRCFGSIEDRHVQALRIRRQVLLRS